MRKTETARLQSRRSSPCIKLSLKPATTEALHAYYYKSRVETLALPLQNLKGRDFSRASITPPAKLSLKPATTKILHAYHYKERSQNLKGRAFRRAAIASASKLSLKPATSEVLPLCYFKNPCKT
jgi:hypothetical protein